MLRDLTNLSGFFKRAKRLKWLSDNPYDECERVTVKSSGDFNVLSVAELEAVARAALSDEYAALFRVAGYTGLRQGELRALRSAISPSPGPPSTCGATCRRMATRRCRSRRSSAPCR